MERVSSLGFLAWFMAPFLETRISRRIPVLVGLGLIADSIDQVFITIQTYLCNVVVFSSEVRAQDTRRSWGTSLVKPHCRLLRQQVINLSLTHARFVVTKKGVMRFTAKSAEKTMIKREDRRFIPGILFLNCCTNHGAVSVRVKARTSPNLGLNPCIWYAICL